ncbi:MAG: Ig-like domain-containing protein, partial [Clostridia bacterium]|nr:Ig-like domain-containing protein [Clostridia bacterium]
MKRQLTAVVLSLCMAFSSVGVMYGADESTDTSEEETVTETTTEETTETTTEDDTTTETTTKSSESSSVSKDYEVSVSVDGTKSLSSYVTASGLSASDFTWSTSSSSVATVSSSGKITGEKKGSCTVTAEGTKGSKTYTYIFYVTVSSSSSSSTTTKSFTIDKGDTKDLYDYVDDDYSASEYDWDSSSTTYVTVTSKGVATGKKDGSATVTATYEDDDVSLEYKFKITVED